jgi:hypothetical protein
LSIALAVFRMCSSILTPVRRISICPCTLGISLVDLVIGIREPFRALPTPPSLALAFRSRAVRLSWALGPRFERPITSSAAISEFLGLHGSSSVRRGLEPNCSPPKTVRALVKTDQLIGIFQRYAKPVSSASQSNRSTHVLSAYPTLTGSRVIVSFPNMSMTLTATVYRPGRSYV